MLDPRLLRPLTIPLLTGLVCAALMLGVNGPPDTPKNAGSSITMHSTLLDVDLPEVGPPKADTAATLANRAAARGLACKGQPEAMTTEQPGLLLGRLWDAIWNQGRRWIRETDGIWTADGVPPLLIVSADGGVLVCALATAVSA